MSKIQKSKYKFYSHNKKPRKTLDINLKGFLCSCNNREKECIKEAYNLLNKYACENPVSETSIPKEVENVDIQDQLENELAGLKSDAKNKQFQVLESGAKNILFISTTLKDPVQLAQKIASDIDKTKIQQTKFLIRLIPIEVTCKAYLKDIENAFKPLSTRYFKENPTSFSIIYNHRNNNSLKKDEVVKAVADIIFEMRPDHKVNLKEAEISVVIEVIKGFVLIGVVPYFIKYKKYNLLALSGQSEEKQTEECGNV